MAWSVKKKASASPIDGNGRMYSPIMSPFISYASPRLSKPRSNVPMLEAQLSGIRLLATIFLNVGPDLLIECSKLFFPLLSRCLKLLMESVILIQ